MIVSYNMLVAQWIEQPPPKRQAEGSSPFQHTNSTKGAS